MGRINLLPHWHLTNPQPAFYDLESATAVDMVAKIYGAMRELQSDYNTYVDEINKTIKEFVYSSEKNQECFMNKISKIVHDYIKMLDDKIKSQDLVIKNSIDSQNKVIQDAIVYIKNNIATSLTEILEEMKESGELDEALANSFNDIATRVTALEQSKVVCSYDGATESLTLVNIGGVE